MNKYQTLLNEYLIKYEELCEEYGLFIESERAVDRLTIMHLNSDDAYTYWENLETY